jgi:hypothetical protein
MINHQICIRFALAAVRLPALLSRGGLIQALRILRGMHGSSSEMAMAFSYNWFLWDDMHSVNGVHVC